MSFMTKVSLDGIKLDIFFDYSVRPDGRQFLGILGIEHKGENIAAIIAVEALPSIYQTLKQDIDENPMSPEDLAGNDLHMKEIREKSHAYQQFLLDPEDAPDVVRFNPPTNSVH